MCFQEETDLTVPGKADMVYSTWVRGVMSPAWDGGCVRPRDPFVCPMPPLLELARVCFWPAASVEAWQALGEIDEGTLGSLQAVVAGQVVVVGQAALCLLLMPAERPQILMPSRHMNSQSAEVLKIVCGESPSLCVNHRLTRWWGHELWEKQCRS